jgi:hypothetical protein
VAADASAMLELAQRQADGPTEDIAGSFESSKSKRSILMFHSSGRDVRSRTYVNGADAFGAIELTSFHQRPAVSTRCGLG